MNSATQFLFHSEEHHLGLALLDSKSIILFANHNIRTLYAVNQGETFPPHTEIHRMISISVQQKHKIEGQLINEPSNGRMRILLLYLYPIPDQVEQNHSFLLILCDGSAINQQYTETKRREKLKTIGEMAAGTANAILNPITVIKGTLQLIEQNIAPKDPVHPLAFLLKPYFKLIFEQITQLNRDIDRFLFMGKPSEVSIAPLTVHRLLQSLLPLAQTYALERNITLICEYPNTEGQLLANEIYLREALKELLLNAMDATDRGGSVMFRTHVADTSVHFIVLDRGHGIDRAIFPYVKEPFFTTKEGALGFGLSYCERILDHLGGHLELTCTKEGTRAEVILPKIL